MLRKMTRRPSSVTWTWFALNGTTPCSKSNGRPLRSSKLEPLSQTASSGPCPPLVSIATRLRSLHSTPLALANALRSAVPASFELPLPGSPQFLALVPAILAAAAAVLTWPQVPDLDDLASVPRRAVASPEAPTDAPNISFAVPAPVPKHPRAAAPLRAPSAPLHPPSPTPSPTDAALASLVEWIPTIPRGCEDEVAHAFHL